MRPDTRFTSQPKEFWAAVRTLGEELGYTARKQNRLNVPTVAEMADSFGRLSLNRELIASNSRPTPLGLMLEQYFQFRAQLLRDHVEPRLMTASQAKDLFDEVSSGMPAHYTPPMNKQKGDKKKPAYLTAIVNLLIRQIAPQLPVNFDPRKLTAVTTNGSPLRTFARRVDGACPDVTNPISIWEIKEYYHTTTFGSRVADGVYETLLDGFEIEEVRSQLNIDIKHYLFLDAHYTWWDCGKSYLCRIVDMMHMGYVDEVLVGREVVEELPRIVGEWEQIFRDRQARGS